MSIAGEQCFVSKYIEFGSGSRILAFMDPNPDPGLYRYQCNQFWKKIFKIIVEKKCPLKKFIF